MVVTAAREGLEPSIFPSSSSGAGYGVCKEYRWGRTSEAKRAAVLNRGPKMGVKGERCPKGSLGVKVLCTFQRRFSE